MASWQQNLKIRIRCLEDENFKLNQQIAFLSRENSLLTKLVLAPPTIMIACEKVVDAAAQITVSANNMLGRRP